MRQGTSSFGRRTIDYLKDTWSELNYAQHRLLEITTETPLQHRQRMSKGQIEGLEALYARKAPRSTD
jgi:hypothetical protein